MKTMKISLDFDLKKLGDSEIKTAPGVDEQIKVDLSHKNLNENQKQKLQALFKSFGGLFLDKMGLTHL